MTSLLQSLKLKKGIVSLVGAGGKTSLMFAIAGELVEIGQSVLTTTTTKMLMPTPKEVPHIVLSDLPEEILDGAKVLGREGALHLFAASGKGVSNEGKVSGLQPDVIDELQKAGQFQWLLVEADGAKKRPLKAPASHEPVIPVCSNAVIAVIGLDSVGKPLDERSVFRPELFADISGISIGELITGSSIAKAVCHKNGIMKGCPSSAVKSVFLNKANSPKRVADGQEIARLLMKENKDNPHCIVIGNALSEPRVVDL